jgi:hypothetical protein
MPFGSRAAEDIDHLTILVDAPLLKLDATGTLILTFPITIN